MCLTGHTSCHPALGDINPGWFKPCPATCAEVAEAATEAARAAAVSGLATDWSRSYWPGVWNGENGRYDLTVNAAANVVVAVGACGIGCWAGVAPKLGTLNVAVTVIGSFLAKGEVVTQQQARSQVEEHRDGTAGGGTVPGGASTSRSSVAQYPAREQRQHRGRPCPAQPSVRPSPILEPELSLLRLDWLLGHSLIQLLDPAVDRGSYGSSRLS